MKKNLNNNPAPISSAAIFAEVMSEMLDSYFTECICHFNKVCMRKRKDETARYFFSMKEVNHVRDNLLNPDSVIVKPLYDNGSIWCMKWIMLRQLKKREEEKLLLKPKYNQN